MDQPPSDPFENPSEPLPPLSPILLGPSKFAVSIIIATGFCSGVALVRCYSF